MIDDFSDDDQYSVSHLNDLGGWTSDDDEQVTDVVAGGEIQLTWNFQWDDWYTCVGCGTCYDASPWNVLQFDVKGATGAENFSVKFDYYDTAACTTWVSTAVAVSSYVSMSTGFQTVQIPFADFTGLDLTRLRAMVISNFSPGAAGTIYLDNIRFVVARAHADADGDTDRDRVGHSHLYRHPDI